MNYNDGFKLGFIAGLSYTLAVKEEKHLELPLEHVRSAMVIPQSSGYGATGIAGFPGFTMPGK